MASRRTPTSGAESLSPLARARPPGGPARLGCLPGGRAALARAAAGRCTGTVDGGGRLMRTGTSSRTTPRSACSTRPRSVAATAPPTTTVARRFGAGAGGALRSARGRAGTRLDSIGEASIAVWVDTSARALSGPRSRELLGDGMDPRAREPLAPPARARPGARVLPARPRASGGCGVEHGCRAGWTATDPRAGGALASAEAISGSLHSFASSRLALEVETHHRGATISSTAARLGTSRSATLEAETRKPMTPSTSAEQTQLTSSRPS